MTPTINLPQVTNTSSAWRTFIFNEIPISKHEENVYRYVDRSLAPTLQAIQGSITSHDPNLSTVFSEFVELIDPVYFLDWLGQEPDPFELILQVPPMCYTFRASQQPSLDGIFVLKIEIEVTSKKKGPR